MRRVRESLDFIGGLDESEQVVVRAAYGVAMRGAFAVVLGCEVAALCCSCEFFVFLSPFFLSFFYFFLFPLILLIQPSFSKRVAFPSSSDAIEL